MARFNKEKFESGEEYTFKVTLVFWRFFDLGLNFTLPEVRAFLVQEGSLKVYDGYHFKYNYNGEKTTQPLKWISAQSHLYAPVCFKIGSDRFSCNTIPNIIGKMRIEGHIHYGSVLVIHCEFLFDNFHKIEDFIGFLEKRIMNEIFYEFKEITSNTLVSTINIEIILHFLAKVESSLILYETKETISKSRNLNIDDEVVNTLEKIFKEVDPSLSLVKGKIREIFMSFSS